MLQSHVLFKLGVALPVDFEKLGVVNALSTPFCVCRVKVAPYAISLFILATGGVKVFLVKIHSSPLYNQLVCEQSLVVSLARVSNAF